MESSALNAVSTQIMISILIFSFVNVEKNIKYLRIKKIQYSTLLHYCYVILTNSFNLLTIFVCEEFSLIFITTLKVFYNMANKLSDNIF